MVTTILNIIRRSKLLILPILRRFFSFFSSFEFLKCIYSGKIILQREVLFSNRKIGVNF